MQRKLHAVSEHWQALAQAKLPFEEARPVSVAGLGAATATLADGAGTNSSKWQSPTAKADKLRRAMTAADTGKTATAMVPSVQRGGSRQGARGDRRPAPHTQQQSSGGGDRAQRAGGQQQPHQDRHQPVGHVRRECQYHATGRECPYVNEPGGCKFSHGIDVRRNGARQAPVQQAQRGGQRSVAFAGYAGEVRLRRGEASAYHDAVEGDSTRAVSPVQQLVEALSPTPPEAAIMRDRAQALRKDKSQRVFLADVEARLPRMIYDPAAAHDLVSGDIELFQTGMSALEFVDISGENISGGCVGSVSAITDVEYEKIVRSCSRCPRRTQWRLFRGARCC